MIIKRCNENQIEKALSICNKKFKGNVIFKRKEVKDANAVVTLRVKDSKGYGSKRGFSGRRTVNACWHVYGEYMEAIFKLNPKAKIISMKRKYESGFEWYDYSLGNNMLASEMCECMYRD